MNTLSIDPRFVPAQLNLMMAPRPARHVRNARRPAVKRLLNWLRSKINRLRSWFKTLMAELATLGVAVEKAL
jgi:hypothetical protein